MSAQSERFDVVVMGSGFSGSLLAWILASHGRRVLVIDRQRHPRFAIGESSTPTADFLLAHLADRWGLKELAPLACWGTWKNCYPEVLCGKKRGFSYYRHHPNQTYQDDATHRQSLLVAASSEDHWSDTHWVRSSVDQFLSLQASAHGAQVLEEHVLTSAVYDVHEETWNLGVKAVGENSAAELRVRSNWIVDASGGGNALAQFVSNPADEAWMRTRTRALYGHFSGVAAFDQGRSPDDPFDGDAAAQHHVLDRGWCWMLRMDHGITSVGLVEPCGDETWNEATFRNRIEQYPSMTAMLENAARTVPTKALGIANRLGRCRSAAIGPGWILLPVTYGFVDPLHSSGIAHGLSGVARIAEAMLGEPAKLGSRLYRYGAALRDELEWIDTLVAGCYLGQPSFACFTAFACYYFIAAIHFEKQLAADPAAWPNGFLQCRDEGLRQVVEQSFQMLSVKSERGVSLHATDDVQAIVECIRHSIAPWNHVGLLEDAARNRIAHSAAPKYAHIASRGAENVFRRD